MDVQMRMMEIAQQVSNVRLQLIGLNLAEAQIDRDIAIRKLMLVPDEGWNGKNTEQRKLAEKQAYVLDGEMNELEKAKIQTKTEIMTVDEQVSGLLNERRAIEWAIRLDMVQALKNLSTYGNIYTDGSAIDTLVDGQFDQQAAIEPEIEYDDNIPF